MIKRWDIKSKASSSKAKLSNDEVVKILLNNRGITTKKEQELFLYPLHPQTLVSKDVGIDSQSLDFAITQIKRAIQNKESIVVYADYDADGITAGTIMWETIHKLGGKVMPYIPHRVDEGYGFSLKGIDNVNKQHSPKLIISVDHGITAWEKIIYAKSLGIDVIVTDHHTKPEKLPECTIVHTTELCGAGVAWFVSKKLLEAMPPELSESDLTKWQDELIALAAIGTIADMVPLQGACRAIAKYGLVALNKTERQGLKALVKNAGLSLGSLTSYDVSHKLAPRLNAMGRLVHALDALRLLVAKNEVKAEELAEVLGNTNKDRQEMMDKDTAHAKSALEITIKESSLQKLVFVSHESYNQGVIGLIAGKLVESYYRPAIVVARGDVYSKASARSISGFNIIEAIRSCSDLLVDAGGHPMAAGFTVETQKLIELESRLLALANQMLTEDLLVRVLSIDMELPLSMVNEALWQALQSFEPFGMKNSEPIFTTHNVIIADARAIGKEGQHLKLTLTDGKNRFFDAIGFRFGEYISQISFGTAISLAYSLDMNEWNGRRKLQLRIKDMQFSPH